MGLDGRFADDERVGDLGVGVAVRYELEDFALSRGEFVERRSEAGAQLRYREASDRAAGR